MENHSIYSYKSCKEGSISLWDGRKVSTKVDNADNASNTVLHETMNYFKFKQFICWFHNCLVACVYKARFRSENVLLGDEAPQADRDFQLQIWEPQIILRLNLKELDDCFLPMLAAIACSLRTLTRSTRPIDAKLWKKLCLWIMFDIKIFHYLPYLRSKYFRYFEMFYIWHI